MRTMHCIMIAACLTAFLAPSTIAAKGEGRRKEKKRKAEQLVQSDVYAKYDKNYNGILDTEEKEAIRKDFAAGSELLKGCDTNKDGKLSDEEINAIPAVKKAEAPPQKERKRKKNQ
ncbi:MAG: hypothetical protein N3B01_08705 [Verrucomicrobiae bacterium]|nr:hypothetical protein [Verrucomicrobiae bacterium]